MSTQVQFHIKANRGNINSFCGIFNTNGAGAISNEKNTARCISVARTAVGKITVTFPDTYQDIYGYVAQLHLTTPNGQFAQIDSVTTSNGHLVMVIGTYTNAYAAVDTTGVVMWDCHVRR